MTYLLTDMHINDAKKILDPKLGNEVSLKCWKKDGSIMVMNKAVCVSCFVRGGTRVMKLIPSMQQRMVRDYLIFEINGKEVYI